MTLEDLFVSHKQVDPVRFEFTNTSLPAPIYLNLDRVQKAVTPIKSDTPESSNDNVLNWKVNGYNPDITDSKDFTTTNSETFTQQGMSWKSPYKDRNKWVADMIAAYKRAGLSNNAIKNLIAKNAMESGWGKSAQGDFNFGNITPGSAWKGRFVKGRDHDASGNPISQKFRAYDSLDHFVKDEIQFLTALYDFSDNDDIDTFVNKLQGGNKGKRKYAGSPNYKEAVKAVYNSLKNKPEYNS